MLEKYKSEFHFFAMLSRMKYINRWGLMRNTKLENISEHSFFVAIIAHALALIENKRCKENLDPEKIATIALFHDVTEILTGDLPTPIKYFDKDLRNAYSKVEEDAQNKLLFMLPEDLREEYRPLICEGHNDSKVDKIIKAADKISALIKCIEEERCGNYEFINAKKSIEEHINNIDLKSIKIFLSEFLPSFGLTLDELQSSKTCLQIKS